MQAPGEVEILLADDSARDAEMTQRVLRKHNLGNHVMWVKDGAEALDFLFCRDAFAGRRASSLPRLMMLDIKMPKIDGIEVLRRVKGDERTRMIPVAVMTSSNEERDVLETYRLGVNSYIVKPVNFPAFVETVANLGMYWILTNRTPDR